MATRYQPDHKGTRRLMLSKEMADTAALFASAGMGYARSISPEASGEYKNSFEVERNVRLVVITKDGRVNPRAGARLHNTSDHAARVEWQHGHAILARTVSYIEGWHP